jgi:hypothetical protein
VIRLLIIIPSLGYIITALIGWSLQTAWKSAALDLMQKSEQRNEPVAVTYDRESFSMPIRFHSLDGTSVPYGALAHPGIWPALGYEPEANALCAWSDWPSDRLLIMELSSGKAEYIRDGTIEVWSNSAPWTVSFEDREIIVGNAASHETREYMLERQPPWAESEEDWEPMGEWYFQYAPDAEALIALHRDWIHHEDTGQLQHLWRCDLQSGVCKLLYGKYSIWEISVNRDASVIGLQYMNDSSGMNYVDFINGNTGALLRTVNTSVEPFAGNRWVGCLDYSTVATTGTYTLRIFDVESNWTEYTIAVEYTETELPAKVSAPDFVLIEPE